MKKTIAALTLAASSSAFAIAPYPGNKPPMKTVCFNVKTIKVGKDTLRYVGCDETDNNQRAHLKNLANGCPSGQVSLTVEADNSSITSCMPPGFIQL